MSTAAVSFVLTSLLIAITEGTGSTFQILPPRLTFRPDFVMACEDKSQKVTKINQLAIESLGANTLAFVANLTLTRTVHSITQANVHIKNCKDSTKSSCEHFQTWRFTKDCCALLAKKDAFWYPMFHNFKPKPQCPVTPGDYILRNGTINMRLLERLPMPLDKFYWRFRLELFDPALIYCGECGVRFMRMRS